MDLIKARAFNQRQGFGGAQLAVIASALKVRAEDAGTWSDTILAGVSSWQSHNGLTADGMVSAKTLAKMQAASEGGVAAPRLIPNFAHEAAAQFPDHRFGIDLSLWNDEVDATKMQGVSFIILKASQKDYIDPRFLEHRKKLAAQMLGNYHLPEMVDGKTGNWTDIVLRDPVYQAKAAAVIARANPAPFGEWLDMEPDSIGNPEKKPRAFSALLKYFGGSRVKAATWVATWLDTFEKDFGAECGIYFSPRLANEGGAELRAVIGKRRRWLAAYPSDPKLPRLDLLPEGWDEVWDIWQCRGSDNKGTPKDEGGKCLGIGGGKKDCDQNVLNPASPLMMKLLAA